MPNGLFSDPDVDEPRSIWRNAPFVILWSGQAVSALGTQASTFAMPLLVLALTHSPAQAGILSALRALGFLLFGLPSGVLADRLDRKRVMILCDLIRAIALGSVPLAAWLGHLTLAQLYPVALIEGVAFVLFANAQSASLPHVVPPSQVVRAISLTMLATSGAMLAGPAVAGALIGLARDTRSGATLAYAFDAATYGGSMLSLFCIRLSFQVARPASSPFRRDLTEGIRYLWNHHPLRAMTLLASWLNVLGGSAYLAMLILARDDLHADAHALGLLFSVISIGSLFSAFVAPAAIRRIRIGVFVILATALQAGGFALEATATSLSMLAGAGMLVSLLVFSSSVAQTSYRVKEVPDTMRGRVSSVFGSLATLGLALGMSIGGDLLPVVGPRHELGFLTVGCALSALLLLVSSVRDR